MYISPMHALYGLLQMLGNENLFFGGIVTWPLEDTVERLEVWFAFGNDDLTHRCFS